MSEELIQVSKKIPHNVMDALWFADGDFKNYVPPNDDIIYQDDFFEISISHTEEPSLIFSIAEVGKIINPAPRLNYYPSYADLTPDERATYLNWLFNIENEIDIGYVFIFYYGLERWLIFGDEYHFENAFELILKLRKYHKNHSFQAYSSEALMVAAIAKNKTDYLEDILTEDFRLTQITLAYLAYVGFYLEARHIIDLSSMVGFKNRRYVKSDPDLFLKILNELLTENYSNNGYYLSKKIFYDTPQMKTQCFANYSLNRKCLIPDITQSQKFRGDILELLTATHEKVKAILREKRRTRN